MTQYVSKSLFKRSIDNIQKRVDKVADSLSSKENIDLSEYAKKSDLEKMVSAKPQITKEDVGLGNVDNTADVDKPISKAV